MRRGNKCLRSKYPWFVFVSTLDERPRPLNTIARVWGVASSGFYSEQAKEAFSILEEAGFLRKVGDYYTANLRKYPEALKELGYYDQLNETYKRLLNEWNSSLFALLRLFERLKLKDLKDVFGLEKYIITEMGWRVPLDFLFLLKIKDKLGSRGGLLMIMDTIFRIRDVERAIELLKEVDNDAADEE